MWFLLKLITGLITCFLFIGVLGYSIPDEVLGNGAVAIVIFGLGTSIGVVLIIIIEKIIKKKKTNKEEIN